MAMTKKTWVLIGVTAACGAGLVAWSRRSPSLAWDVQQRAAHLDARGDELRDHIESLRKKRRPERDDEDTDLDSE